MTPLELLGIIGLVGYAIYRQTQKHEIVGNTRFKLAIIYAVVGIVVGGFYLPHSATSWSIFAFGIVLSIITGLLRARYTKVWKEKGSVYSQGTALTIGLFLGMVLIKFILGTIEYFYNIRVDGGFGEILVMIALMVAVQAELVWRRAQPLGARQTEKNSVRPSTK